MKHAGKCRHLHGHSARADITLESQTLNDQAMVMDFSKLKQIVGKYINDNLDHNLLLHEDDPLCQLLTEQDERFNSLPQHPTAEYIAQMIYEFCKTQNMPVIQVTLWETESANACYTDQHSKTNQTMLLST